MPLKIPSSVKLQQNKSQYLDYKGLVRSRFKEQVDGIVRKYSLEELVLVLDMNTTLLISNLFKIYELVQMKITYLERLQVKRKRMSQLHALYYIPPNGRCIQFLKGDFAQKSVQMQKPKRQYKKIHILFTSFLPHSLLKQIAIYKPLLKRIATNSIKEFYHSSRFISSNVIDFDIEDYGSLAYSKESSQENEKRIRIAQKTMEFVVNLGQVNAVRLYFKQSSNGISQRVAEVTQKMVNKYIGSLLQNRSHLLNRQADDVTIMIFDRSVDPVTPLLHSFTFEALLFDLLKVTFQGTQKAQDKQYYQFNQFNDSIYQVYRYKHISKALQQLPELLNKQNQKLSSLQKPGSSKAQQNDIDITQLNQKVKALRRQIQILDILFKQLKNKDLTQIGELQMSLATGLSEDGKNTSSSKIYNDVLEIIDSNTKLSRDEKLRLGLLVLCCIKLSKKDYEKLIQKFSDQQDKWALKNIIALGITYDKGIGKSTKAISKDQQNIALERMQLTNMPLDRYTPILQLLIPMIVQILSGQNPKIKRLDDSIFGCLKCICLQDQQLDITRFNKEKFIIIMLGGMSFGEISALRRKQELRGVIIGADEIIQPKKYIEMLKNIDILK